MWRILVIAFGLLAAMPCAGTAAADPLTDAIGGRDEGICYRRTYDAAHLAKNPDQMTHAIQLSMAPHPRDAGALARLAIADAEGEVYAIGECFWKAKAGLGDDGKPYTATFKPGPGLDCRARASPNWASEDEVKDGGLFAVDMRDGKSMTIHTQDEIAAWPQLNRDAPAGFYPLGDDDRIFRVDRVSADNCMELVDLFGWDYNFEE
jgi:hypothetical protein